MSSTTSIYFSLRGLHVDCGSAGLGWAFILIYFMNIYPKTREYSSHTAAQNLKQRAEILHDLKMMLHFCSLAIVQNLHVAKPNFSGAGKQTWLAVAKGMSV